MLLRNFLIVIIIFINASSTGQVVEPSFRTYTELDGLAGSNVSSFAQDSSGFIWIGTNNGLSKFDGTVFTNYHNVVGDSTSLSNDEIRNIEVDAEGKIWAVTRDGINIYDHLTDQFQRVYFPEDSIFWTANWFNDLTFDGNRTMWLGREQMGIAKIDIYTLETKEFHLNQQQNPSSFSLTEVVYSLLYPAKQDSILWIGSNSLIRFNLQTGEYKCFPWDNKRQALRVEFIDENGKIWIGTWGYGILIFDQETETFENVLPPHNDHLQGGEGINLSIHQKDSCNFWFTSLNYPFGLYNYCDDNYEFYRPSATWDHSILAEGNSRIFEDNSERIWIAHSRGLSCLDGAFQQFQNIKGESFKERSGSFKGEWVLETARGNYHYCDIESELYFFDHLNGEVKNMDEQKRFIDYHHLQELKTGVILTGRSGIALLDTSEQKLIQGGVPGFPDSLSSFSMTNVIQIGDSLLLVHVEKKGLLQCNIKKNYWTFIEGTDGYSMSHIHQVNDSMIWLGGNQKLMAFNLLSKSFGPQQSIQVNKKDQDLYTNLLIEVTYIQKDSSGDIWLMSELSPPLRVNEKMELTVMNEEYGFKARVAYDCHFKENGDGAFITSEGLAYWKADEQKFEFFYVEDGLAQNDLQTYWSHYIGPYEEKYIFGTQYGWQVFNPESDFSDNDFGIYFIQASSDFREAERTLELNYDYSNLNLDFGVTSYSFPNKTRSFYRLSDSDEWIDIGSSRNLQLNSLSPGNYSIQLKAKNFQGKESFLEPIKLVINPPYYKTIWFLIFCLILFGGLTYLILRIRIRRVKQKLVLKQRAAESELKSLQAQMNPHFLFNSLNSIKALILEQEEDAAISYLTKFSRLVRGILNCSGEQFITLQEDLGLLHLYLEIESLRFGDSFNYSIQNDLENENDLIKIPPLLSQVYVENAIWHGLMQKEGDRKLEVRIEDLGDGMNIVIQDNGIGRLKSSEIKSKSATNTKSLGMQLAESRLHTLNELTGKCASVSIEDLLEGNQRSLGTKVTIHLPYYSVL